jgi:hypothetical protein
LCVRHRPDEERPRTPPLVVEIGAVSRPGHEITVVDDLLA